MSTASDALLALGFSEIEALVYCCVLEAGPVTGYRVAQLIGKAAANTYQALASLSQKGALIVDDGDTRLVRAVSPKELMATLARRFEASRRDAEAVLAGLSAARADERVYQLQTAEQTFARARTMLAGAKDVVLADLFPDPAQRLAGDLAAAAKRGARVAAILYQEERPIPGVLCVAATNIAVVKASWPGQHLGLVVDAREHLQAMFDRNCDALHQAIWSNSVFLSCIQHSHFVAEMLSLRIEAAGGISADPVATKLAKLSLMRLKPRGLAVLNKTYSAPRRK